MTRFSLLGSVALAGSLIAGTALAAQPATTVANPASTGGSPSSLYTVPVNGNIANNNVAANNTANNTTANNTAANNAAAAPATHQPVITPQKYANVGFGSYAANQEFIQNGNNNNNNNNGNNNDWRPQQRNPTLADNGDARASKVIGTDVYNKDNQQVGTVNDILLGKNGVWAVIKTNKEKVAVPFNELRFGDAANNGNEKIVIPDTTQAQLNTLPVFHYNVTNYQEYQNAGNNNNNGTRNYANNGNRAGNGWLGGGNNGINNSNRNTGVNTANTGVVGGVHGVNGVNGANNNNK